MAGGVAAAETKVVNADGASLSRHTGWARSSLVPAPPGRIVIRYGDCPRHPRFVACVQTWRPRTIFMRRGLANERAVFLHELGHVFDLTVMSRADRMEFKRLHGRRGAWFGGNDPPAEWFGDAYALCARRRAIARRPAPSVYEYAPTPYRHAASCRLIERSAKRLEPQRPKPVPPVVVEEQPPVQPAPAPAPAPPAQPQPQRWYPYTCLGFLTCYSRYPR